MCGGTHVSATSEIGFVKITSETSVGANLRRIEAVTSFDALAYMNRVEAELKEAAESLRVPLFDVSERTASNMKTLKDLQTKLKRGREAVADDGINALLETAQTSAAGYPVVFGRMPEADAGQMRNMWDVLRARVWASRAPRCWPRRKTASPRCWRPVRRRRWRRASTQAPSSRRSRGTSRAAAAEGRHGAAGGKDASGIDAAFRLRATCCCRVVGWAPCRGCGAQAVELARNVHRTFRLDRCGAAKRSVTSPRRGNLAAHPRHGSQAVLPLGAPALRAALQPAGVFFGGFSVNRRSPFILGVIMLPRLPLRDA
ncbi:MAG: hypothetical protein ACLSGS_08330 [Adlercreutzia sp.]